MDEVKESKYSPRQMRDNLAKLQKNKLPSIFSEASLTSLQKEDQQSASILRNLWQQNNPAMLKIGSESSI